VDHCLADVVFASIAADEHGVSIAIWKFNKTYVGPPLTLVDFDQQPFSPNLFTELAARLHQEAVPACARARKLIPPAALAVQASAVLEDYIGTLLQRTGDIDTARKFDLVIEEIDVLLKDRDALLLACAAQVGFGR